MAEANGRQPTPPTCGCGEGFHLDEQPQGDYHLVHGKLFRLFGQRQITAKMVAAGCLELKAECGGGAI